MLAWTIYSAWIGAAVALALPRKCAQWARAVALLAALCVLGVVLAVLAQHPSGAMQSVAQRSWIPALGIQYSLAADGVSLVLLLLTGIAAVAGVLFSWNVERRAPEFFALSATQIAHGIGFAQVMMLPALFTAGMMLLDTADSIFMAGAYGWAMLHPARKLWYNFTITAASVLMAAFIGSVEIADLLGERLHMSSGLWSRIAALNNNLTLFGICALGVFAFCWIAASVLFRRYRSPAI